MQFINIDKRGNRFFRRVLRLKPKDTTQIASIFIRSTNVKKVNNLSINLGIKISYLCRLKNIVLNRFRAKRIFTSPSPYWWGDFRTPSMEVHQNQPEITKIIGVYLHDDNPPTDKPVNITKSIIKKDISYIEFSKPTEIPLGYPQGRTLRIDLELNAKTNWKGVIRLISNINGANQFVINKVEVSSKYGVVK